MSWNPVYDLIMELKSDYIEYCGMVDMWHKKNGSVVLYWADSLAKKIGNDYYLKMLAPLSLSEWHDYALFRYSSIWYEDIENFWDIENGFYRECRSVVIDLKNDKIVLAPFCKFFNLNEMEETSYENIQNRINNANVIEFSNKLDGSMCSARWYNDELVVSGSKALDPANSWHLAANYDYLLSHSNYLKMLGAYKDFTFIFEMIHPEDIHVVKYSAEDYGLHLIGMRNIHTGKELNYKTVLYISKKYGIDSTSLYDVSLDEVLDSLGDKKGFEAEGYVLNIDGYKVKIKYDDYVSLHKIFGNFTSPSVILSLIKEDAWDDTYAKIPEVYKGEAAKIAQRIRSYVVSISNEVLYYYVKLDKTKSRKEIAYEIYNSCPERLRSYLFMLLDGKDIDYLKNKKYKDIEKYFNAIV